MALLVEEDLIKESVILKHLTMDNNNKYIVKFVDFFESEEFLYLCTEFVEGMNLKEFVTASHKYINEGRLSLKEYRKRMKHILWQLTTTMYWLHDVYHCCHLDLVMENVMLQNVSFEDDE